MQGAQQHVGVEHIDPHGRAHPVRVERRRAGGAVCRLLLESDDAVLVVDIGDAEARGFLGRYQGRGNGDVGRVLLVPGDHVAVVHLIDVIAGEDDRVTGVFGFDALEILEDGVRRALVPVLVDPFHGGKDLDVLAQFGGEDVPAVADVAVQFQGLILC